MAMRSLPLSRSTKAIDMNWLQFLGLDRLLPKPAPMTPETADPIIDIVAAALQENDGLPYHPLSSLQGFDVPQIDTALKLWIANQYLLLSLSERGAELDGIAAEFATTPQLVATLFVADEERNKLKCVTKGSQEYRDLQIKMMPSFLDANGNTDPKFASLELITSFAKFCRQVGAADPLYWQKIYTRIGLPYEKRCPQGNDPVFID